MERTYEVITHYCDECGAVLVSIYRGADGRDLCGVCHDAAEQKKKKEKASATPHEPPKDDMSKITPPALCSGRESYTVGQLLYMAGCYSTRARNRASVMGIRCMELLGMVETSRTGKPRSKRRVRLVASLEDVVAYLRRRYADAADAVEEQENGEKGE